MIKRRKAIGLALATMLVPRGAKPQSLTLRDGEILKGLFVQQRFLQGFNAPLASSGSFMIVPAQGLVWRSETPFALLTVMGAGGLVQRVVGGTTTRYPASRLPFLAELYEVFSAALGGDWGKLTGIFNVQKSGASQNWQVILTPRRSDANMPLKNVAVQGDRYVNSVMITRSNGDWDRIVFSQQIVSHESPDGETAELLRMIAHP